MLLINFFICISYSFLAILEINVRFETVNDVHINQHGFGVIIEKLYFLIKMKGAGGSGGRAGAFDFISEHKHSKALLCVSAAPG